MERHDLKIAGAGRASGGFYNDVPGSPAKPSKAMIFFWNIPGLKW